MNSKLDSASPRRKKPFFKQSLHRALFSHYYFATAAAAPFPEKEDLIPCIPTPFSYTHVSFETFCSRSFFFFHGRCTQKKKTNWRLTTYPFPSPSIFYWYDTGKGEIQRRKVKWLLQVKVEGRRKNGKVQFRKHLRGRRRNGIRKIPHLQTVSRVIGKNYSSTCV